MRKIKGKTLRRAVGRYSQRQAASAARRESACNVRGKSDDGGFEREAVIHLFLRPLREACGAQEE